MKNILIILISLLAFSCKAQTISLEQEAQCSNNPNCPDYTYAKDINNSLDKYIGTWKGTYNGKIYEMKFNKSLYQDFMGLKRDIITGRVRIKTDTTSGLVGLSIYDNFNETNDDKTRFSGLGFQSDLQSYKMYFAGNSPKGCLNRGRIYLKIKTNTPNQMTIVYWSDNDIVIGDCPSAFEQTFPEKQLIILTKQ
jgi:hypothetical protein